MNWLSLFYESLLLFMNYDFWMNRYFVYE